MPPAAPQATSSFIWPSVTFVTRPRVEPRAEPIWTIGPSRPTDPPEPMVRAEASVLTTATLGLMRPPRWATATMTSGTPCPRASLANRFTSGPYSRPPTTGASTTKPGPSQAMWGWGLPGSDA